MRKILFSTLLLCFGLGLVYAQDNCSAFYPLSEGATHTYQLYDKKNKPSATSTYTVKSLSNIEGTTKATMNTKVSGPKSKDQVELEFAVTCTGDGITIDFNSLVSPQLKKQMEQMAAEVDVSGINLEVPNTLSVGQELPDAEILVSINMGMMNMKTEVRTTDRKVIAQETLTTPAGSFDCYVITSTINSKAMMTKMTSTDKIWLAKGIGLVKQETYNKKGKLSSKMELRSFSK